MLLSAKHCAGITSTSKRSLNPATSVEIRPGYHTFMNAILEGKNFVKILNECRDVQYDVSRVI